MFWADSRARSSCLYFENMVMFDVTYKTNHLCLPFASFISANHHHYSILRRCALFAVEQEDTFKWLFTQWFKCIHDVAPTTIITDQDIRMGNAY